VDVSLGTNHFVDVDTIVSIRNEPTLKIADGPLRITIVTPADLPSGRSIRVVENRPEPTAGSSEVAPQVRVVVGDTNVAVFWEQFLIAVATQLGVGSVHVHVDLRPIGILLFDDASGLHVGAMQFSNSTVKGPRTAFMLG
jgi:hypothetical protein